MSWEDEECRICFSKGRVIEEISGGARFKCLNCGTTFSGFSDVFGFEGWHNPAARDLSHVGEFRRVAGGFLGIGGLFEAIFHQSPLGIAIAIAGGILYHCGKDARAKLELESDLVRREYPHWQRKR